MVGDTAFILGVASSNRLYFAAVAVATTDPVYIYWMGTNDTADNSSARGVTAAI
jgi:hypothetical protein